MPQILPLRGLRYDASAGPLSDLLAPPYDVITPTQRDAIAARSPFNAVHLELAEGGEERYARVAGLVSAWEAGGQLRRDDVPMLYVYEQEFAEGETTYRRRALIAGVEAQPWEEGAVRPHEFTMSGPKEDRLKLLEATRVQLSPVFMIARDRAGQLAQFLTATIDSRAPDASATTAEGETHRMWLVEAGRLEMRWLAPLLSESFYIADGHHRYETAVNYKQRRIAEGIELERDHPARFAMTAIVPASDPGLVIRPIHRIVPRTAPDDWRDRLGGLFEISDAPPDMGVQALAGLADEASGTVVAVGLGEGPVVLQLRPDASLAAHIPAGRSDAWARISPNVVRYGILQPLWGIHDADLAAGLVEYTHDAAEVDAELKRRPGGTAFLLPPVEVSEVISLADRGERMPQKSTFFHPKLGTGLVFHPLYA